MEVCLMLFQLFNDIHNVEVLGCFCFNIKSLLCFEVQSAGFPVTRASFALTSMCHWIIAKGHCVVWVLIKGVQRGGEGS